jgi:hypothetical protein
MQNSEAGDRDNPVALQPVRKKPLLEISVAPAYVYNDSDSAYTFRRYYSAAPAMSGSANVWLSSQLGLAMSYLGTLSGHISDPADGNRNTSAHQEWFTIGLRSSREPRQGDSAALKTATLTFGLDYLEYQMRVAGNSINRQKLESSGVQLVMEAEVPTAPAQRLTLGFSFSPKLQHKELRNGGFFKSGAGVDASAVGVSIGGRLIFDSDASIFWRVSHSIEKDLFSGSSTTLDPQSGATPSGVSVTNSFTVFRLGYTWGR